MVLWISLDGLSLCSSLINVGFGADMRAEDLGYFFAVFTSMARW